MAYALSVGTSQVADQVLVTRPHFLKNKDYLS